MLVKIPVLCAHRRVGTRFSHTKHCSVSPVVWHPFSQNTVYINNATRGDRMQLIGAVRGGGHWRAVYCVRELRSDSPRCGQYTILTPRCNNLKEKRSPVWSDRSSYLRQLGLYSKYFYMTICCTHICTFHLHHMSRCVRWDHWNYYMFSYTDNTLLV